MPQPADGYREQAQANGEYHFQKTGQMIAVDVGSGCTARSAVSVTQAQGAVGVSSDELHETEQCLTDSHDQCGQG